jgi:phage baseplate assembly protein W
MTATDLIGRGWDFPTRVGAAGGIRLAGGGDEVDASIRMILSTSPGERVMRPAFGCAIWDHVFAPLHGGTLGLLEQATRDALAQWEPRIDVEAVTVAADDAHAVARIGIDYTVRATNDRRNLVYPFYVIPHEEIP